MRVLIALAVVLAAVPAWAMPDQGKWEFVPNEVSFVLPHPQSCLISLHSPAYKMLGFRLFLNFLCQRCSLDDVF